MTTRDQAVTAAGQALATARATRDSLTPRQAAQAAWHPGGPSVDDLEDRIRAQRGLAPFAREAAS